MNSTEVFLLVGEESSCYGSSASGSPSTPWPTGSCTAVGRAVERDTTTPAAIVESMRAVPLGGGLQPAGRERLAT
ncbi:MULTISPECIES: hypothetical protein [Streptomyces]|nr:MULTISPECIES: hypothetical protein [Streptomyces]MBZ6114544.1 hypothetical protein [Streptomyces olivaceus]MBZ6128343.1 hypothetical protein [Streptomyces olivaceus]MBZ6149249.1 hypothetical protein [Streptomyces olivaceus]MBZ6163107.1 hypothetical protein [Streptomyces olivaceus]MBZ6190911.1 hypothetical protein [Streptomyces olivaceus]